MIDKLVLIVLLVICAMLFAFAFLFAYVIARFYKAEEKSPPVAKKLTEADEKARRAAQRLQKEVTNMLTYNGEPQEEIIDD
jgi:hypothetical protein